MPSEKPMIRFGIEGRISVEYQKIVWGNFILGRPEYSSSGITAIWIASEAQRKKIPFTLTYDPERGYTIQKIVAEHGILG